MIRRVFSTFVFIFISLTLFAQKNIDIYATNWWANMENPNVQLMLHGKEVGRMPAFTIKYPGVTVTKIHKAPNPNYVFLDLTIAENTQPGILKIKSGTKVIYFELKPRRTDNGITYSRGVTSHDLIYLIMPDRFSNGDESNDRVHPCGVSFHGELIIL